MTPVYQADNWTWKHPENTVIHEAQTVTCPACRSIDDNMPVSTLTLSGSFLLNIEMNHQPDRKHRKEKAEHALERIINLTDSAADLIVTNTGIHIANRLGHALEAAFNGNSDYQHGDDEYGLSVNWTPDK